MLSAVASRYAKAFVDVATGPRSTSNPAGILAQLRSVAQVIAGSHELRTVLLSPAVAPSRKRDIVQKLLGASQLGTPLDKQTLNFLYVVIDHRRVADFPAIVDAFEVLLDDRLGFVRADVLSAKPLDSAQQARLETEISRMAGKKAKLKFSTDPALIAGVVARIGSTVYDGSVRGQLDRSEEHTSE